MEFGSSYVYWNNVSEYEVLSDDELDEGMQLSGASSDSDEDYDDRKKKRRHNWRNVESYNDMYEKQCPTASGRKERRADTNVVSVNFSKLIPPNRMFTGDSVYCQSCGAVLSYISQIDTKDGNKIWTCEFCSTSNDINIMEEEIPKEQDITYLLEPAPSTQASGPSGTDASLVIFCIDISGSMNQTKKVPKNMRESLKAIYISRIQAAKTAVNQQLEKIATDFPSKRVSVILFHDEVEVLGDCINRPVIVPERQLDSRTDLINVGKNLKMPASIRDTKKRLSQEVSRLSGSGGTALGPALLIAVTMAGQHTGSKIIMCTDGIANLGIGAMDSPYRSCSVEGTMNDDQFYEEIGREAASKGYGKICTILVNDLPYIIPVKFDSVCLSGFTVVDETDRR